MVAVRRNESNQFLAGIKKEVVAEKTARAKTSRIAKYCLGAAIGLLVAGGLVIASPYLLGLGGIAVTGVLATKITIAAFGIMVGAFKGSLLIGASIGAAGAITLLTSVYLFVKANLLGESDERLLNNLDIESDLAVLDEYQASRAQKNIVIPPPLGPIPEGQWG